MNKKERVQAAIDKQPVDHVPACFSLHFPREIAFGDAAVKAHLDFSRQTDCDILKIMNENLVPAIGEMNSPADWAKVPAYNRHSPFMQQQLDMIKRILDEAGDAYSLATIHGICASTIHPLEAKYGYEPVRRLFVEQMRTNKQPMLDARQRIADAMSDLAQACIEIGCNGVYYAALGAEKHFFTDEEFAEAVEPFDRQILTAIREADGDIFLHICKNNLNMQRYRNYPDLCDVVNWGVYEVPFSLEEGRKLFPNATIMGGLANRSGVMVDGTIEELQASVRRLIADFGSTGFILGADCTLPTDIPVERIRAAVHAAII